MDPGTAIRRYQAQMARQQAQRERQRAQVARAAKKLRFAYVEGHDYLYKFKPMSGESADHVKDMIENSRIYFSIPDQFNDPFDCAPVCKTARPTTDTAFVQEMIDDQERMIAEANLSPAEVEKLRESQVDVHQLGPAVTKQLREQMRADVRVFCLTARQDHPLQWAHYADSHKGVCLHFAAQSGSLFGLARAVKYRKARDPVLVPLHYNSSEDALVDRMVQIKARFWSYETEYRIIGHANEHLDWGYKFDGRYVAFPAELLTGITFGLRTSAPDREMIIGWAATRYPKLKIYEAVEDPHQFALHVQRIA